MLHRRLGAHAGAPRRRPHPPEGRRPAAALCPRPSGRRPRHRRPRLGLRRLARHSAQLRRRCRRTTFTPRAMQRRRLGGARSAPLHRPSRGAPRRALQPATLAASAAWPCRHAACPTRRLLRWPVPQRSGPRRPCGRRRRRAGPRRFRCTYSPRRPRRPPLPHLGRLRPSLCPIGHCLEAAPAARRPICPRRQLAAPMKLTAPWASGLRFHRRAFPRLG